MNNYELQNVFEFLEPTKVKILANNAILEMGMSMEDVLKVMTPTKGTLKQTKLIFEDKDTEYTSISQWYNDMALQLDFRNNKLMFVQIPTDSVLMFKKINLADINYKRTLKLLERENFKIIEASNDESIIDELNLMLYHPYENELETVCIFMPGYYLSEEQKAKYAVSFYRENGYDVVKYTIKKHA